eukprot:5896833-Amphidinium_carterae.1
MPSCIIEELSYLQSLESRLPLYRDVTPQWFWRSTHSNCATTCGNNAGAGWQCVNRCTVSTWAAHCFGPNTVTSRIPKAGQALTNMNMIDVH